MTVGKTNCPSESGCALSTGSAGAFEAKSCTVIPDTKVSPTSTPMRLLWRAVQPRREKALTGTAARSLRRRCRRPQSPPFRQPQRRAIPPRHGATTRRMCKQVVFFFACVCNSLQKKKTLRSLLILRLIQNMISKKTAIATIAESKTAIHLAKSAIYLCAPIALRHPDARVCSQTMNT